MSIKIFLNLISAPSNSITKQFLCGLFITADTEGLQPHKAKSNSSKNKIRSVKTPPSPHGDSISNFFFIDS